MADLVQRIEYYYVEVPNRAGAAAEVFNVLKTRSVNLVAFNGFPTSDGRAQLVLVPSGGEGLVTVARETGIKLVGPKVAFLISDWEYLGAVADILSKLGEAGINVTAMQAIAGGDWRYSAIIWIKPQDIDKAAKVLGIA
jgi:hypothetical protein